jgi:hypothetical protein
MPGRPLALVVQSGSCAHRMPCIRSPSDLDSRSAATARGRGGPEARSAMTEAGGSSRGYPRGGPATNDRESSWRTIAFVIETARQRTPGLRRDQAPSPWITAKWPPTMPVGRAIAVRQNRMVGGARFMDLPHRVARSEEAAALVRARRRRCGPSRRCLDRADCYRHLAWLSAVASSRQGVRWCSEVRPRLPAGSMMLIMRRQ